MSSVGIVWFRLDLRLADNPALHAAMQACRQVIPVYIHSPEEEGRFSAGAASRWWLHQSLESLDRELNKLGSRLIIRKGDSAEELISLVESVDAKSVFFNRLYYPHARTRDMRVESALLSRGIAVESFNGSLMHEPQVSRTQEGRPYKIFTHFWNHLIGTLDRTEPLQAPCKISFPEVRFNSLPLAALELEPRINWTDGIQSTWRPGEPGALKKLNTFTGRALMNYATDRDRPDHNGVSMLSPHLHFGEISPRQVWQAARAAGKHLPIQLDIATYLKELGWREFAYHVLFNFPKTSDEPLRPQFKAFPWCENEAALERWQKGQTGFPIVDAGMRQLWKTGWMHNRVRMIAASFLTKDLLLSWRQGAEWFWDTLVDADLASNTFGWQWSAGCGADAAPYFRIFNPILQGEKFDPYGKYVRKWLPELSKLPDRWVHKPWLAPDNELTASGIKLGKTYPAAMIDHAWARNRALDAHAQMKVMAG